MSFAGTTEPKYFLTKSGYFSTASDIGQNTTPALSNASLTAVPIDTESNTASTAIPSSFFTSSKGIPNFLYVSNISCGKSSSVFTSSVPFGAE